MLVVVESRSVLEKNALESELSADLFLYVKSEHKYKKTDRKLTPSTLYDWQPQPKQLLQNNLEDNRKPFFFSNNSKH